MGGYSVKADEDPAFQGVAKAVRLLRQAEKQQEDLTDNLNRRIIGDARRVERENAVMKEQREYDLMQQKAYQDNDRRNHWQARRKEVDLICTGHQLKIDHANRLYEQMKEAALVKGDNETARSTKAKADAVYARVKNEIAGHRLTLRETIRQAEKDRTLPYGGQGLPGPDPGRPHRPPPPAAGPAPGRARGTEGDGRRAHPEGQGVSEDAPGLQPGRLRPPHRQLAGHEERGLRPGSPGRPAQRRAPGEDLRLGPPGRQARSEVTKLLQDPQGSGRSGRDHQRHLRIPKSFDPELVDRMAMVKAPRSLLWTR